GRVQKKTLQQIGLDQKWLQKTLEHFNIESPEQIFYAALDTCGDFYFQKKIG
ncbi:MAG: YetF domain-containing protein, partial [Halanaerobiales bacterium]